MTRYESTGDLFPLPNGTVLTAANSANAGTPLLSVPAGGFASYDTGKILVPGSRGSIKIATPAGTTTTGGEVLGNFDAPIISTRTVFELGLEQTTDVTLCAIYNTSDVFAFRLVRIGSTKLVRITDFAGTNISGLPAFTITAGVTLAIDIRLVKGTTTTDGQIRVTITRISDGAVVFDYTNTAANTGTANFKNAQWGKMSATGATGTGVLMWLADTVAEDALPGYAAPFRRAPQGRKYNGVLVMGASNAVSKATDEGPTGTYSDRVWMIPQRGAHQGILVQAAEYLPHLDPSGGISPAQTFVADYIAGGQLPAGEDIVIIPAAYGGTGFTVPDSNGNQMTWRADAPDDANNRLLYAIRAANAALALGANTSKLVAIIHNPGSTDGTNLNGAAGSDETYRQYITAMIQTLRTAFGASIPMLIMQSRPALIAAETRHRMIDDVLRTITGVTLNGGGTPVPANKVAYTGYSPGPDGTQYNMGDAVHYNAAGIREHGHRLYSTALPAARANTGGSTPDPGVTTGVYVGRFPVQVYVGAQRVA